MLHSVGERKSVIGGDFGKKVRVERWNGGSRLKVRERENELRDAELLDI